MKKVSIFIFFLILSFSLFCEGNNLNNQKLTSSIAMACHYKDFSKIEEVLDCYERQTNIPDEVVLSISQYEMVDPEVLQKIEETTYSFKLKIVKTKENVEIEENRNIAAEHTSKDIIIFQDGYDLPHPQFVEIVEYFFRKKDIYHLIHKNTFDRKKQYYGPDSYLELYEHYTPYKIKDIPYFEAKSSSELWQLSISLGSIYTSFIAIKQGVQEKVKFKKYSPAGCVGDNNRICNDFKKSCFIYADLIILRPYFSSTRL
jgi:hypothetical protein